MDKWQPIETAPTGTMSLFCSMTETDVSKWVFVDWLAGGKFMLHPKWSATHWQPVPLPPSVMDRTSSTEFRSESC